MLQITNIRQGAILNHNHGVETEKSLTVRFEGISDYPGPVDINGIPCFRDGRLFSAEVPLTEKVNTVTVSSVSAFGEFSQSIKVVWDKKSFKRCNFYIDDHSFFWTDLMKERPRRAFDHFYLKNLKELNQKFGLKVTLNTFYHNDHHDYNICDVPDIWKQEFIDNSGWLKFSPHSWGEFPDRPYIESSEDEFIRDYDRIRDELVRIAGEKSFIAPLVIHWANISPGCVRALIDRGLRAYAGAFRPRLMGGPSASERAAGNKENNIERSAQNAEFDREKQLGRDFGFGFDEHYNAIEENSYLEQHRAFYNPYFGITFFKGYCCCNLVKMEDIKKRYDKAFADAKISGNELFGAASHEQYSFPYYHNYIHDHDQRIGYAIQQMVENGCTPVFFSEGFMGNMSWEQ